MPTSIGVLSSAAGPDTIEQCQDVRHLPNQCPGRSQALQEASKDGLRILATILAAALFFLLPLSRNALGQTPNTIPLINQPLVPDAVAPGGVGFILTVNGTGFVSGASITWNGLPLTTTFVNNSRLTATVPASSILNGQTATIAVVNPSPGSGKSNTVFFTVILPISLPVFSNASGSPITVGTSPQSVVTGNFNSDSYPDLAVANFSDSAITILLGNGAGTFTATALSPATGHAPASIATGDFTGSGRLDLAVANSGSNNVTILLGNGDGTFTEAASSPVAAGVQPSFVAAGDLNGDGKLDLAVANRGSNNVTVLLGNGDGTFAPATGSPVPVGTGPQGLAVGDFNGDNKLDLAVADSGSNNLAILLGNGSGSFAPAAASPITVGVQPSSVVAADFNSDSRLDLAVANKGSNSVTILLGNGDGTLTPTTSSPATGNGPQSVAVADLNGDSMLDLVIVNFFDHSVTILLGSGSGAFTPAVAAPATGANPYAVVAADFSSDGRIDLAVANSGFNTVSILMQPLASGVVFSPASLTFHDQIMGTTSAPESVSVSSTGTAPLYVTGISASSNFAAKTNCPIAGAKTNCNNGLPSGVIPYTNVYYITKPGFDSSFNAKVQMVVGEGRPEDYVLQLTPLPTAPSQTFCGLIPLTNTFSAEAYVPTAAERNGDYSTFSVQLTDPLTGQPFIGNIIPISRLQPGVIFAWPITANQASNCSIDATFTPSATGPVNGTLSVTDNASDSPQEIGLSGTGVSTAVVSVAPTDLTFAGQLVGTSSAPKTVTLTNTGAASLTIMSLSTGTGDFAQTNNCPTSLSIGGSCTISVTFKPSAAVINVGSLMITDNAAGSPQSITLTGQGQDFGLTARTTSLTITPGVTANFDLLLSPQGGFNHAVDLSCSGAPQGSNCTVTPASATLDGTNSSAVGLRVITTGNALLVPGGPGSGAPPSGSPPLAVWLTFLSLLGMVAMAKLSPKGGCARRLAPFAAIALLVVLWAACGGGVNSSSTASGNSTPSGTYTLTVTGKSGGLTRSASVTLKVQ
jgi:FG-GAP-like repeat/Cep192 domain 4